MAAQETVRQDKSRHDGGPLEKSHFRDMVLRNAAEHVAHAKKTKHLESQKKAFERQNTRDNDEMRSLLQRLQTSSQQTGHLDGELLYDSDEDSCTLSDEDEVDGVSAVTPRIEPANPYPITIVPRFGATPQPTRSQSRVSVTSRPDDLQDSMSSLGIHSRCSVSSMATESQTSTTRLSHDEDVLGDWLARPDAISSVRRQRKSVNEQSHRKVKVRPNEAYEPSFVNSPRMQAHSRSNSLKEKKRSVVGLEDVSETRALGLSRRSRSMKEQKHSNLIAPDIEGRPKPAARSFSMLTKCSLQEFDQRQNEKRLNRKTSDRNINGLDSITSTKGGKNTPRTGSFKTKKTTNENVAENGQLNRKNSRKGETQNMQGQYQEGETLYPPNESSSKKTSGSRRKLGSTHSSDASPNISPLTKENEVFRF